MNTLPTLTRNRILAARTVAVCADLLQIGLVPVFGEGFISPFNDALDIAVCLTLTALVGWHFAFLPGFLIEMMPMVDLAPTWTIAVLVATRHGAQAQPQSTPPTQGDVVVEDAPSGPPAGQVIPKLLSPGGRESGTK